MRPIISKDRLSGKYVVDSDTGCWNWIKSLDKDGYAKYSWFYYHNLRLCSSTIQAHILMYEAEFGRVPEDK